MAVAHGTEVQAAAHALAAAWTTSFTPASTPRGVVVAIVQDLGTEDQVSGVTYGGTAMTRVRKEDRPGATLGCVYLYFLGASIPGAGGAAQNVVITSTGTRAKRAVITSVTAANDTEAVPAGGAGGNGATANPSLSITPTAAAAIYYALFHDANAVVTTVQAGSTQQFSHDFGSEIGQWARKSVAAGGATTIGYTLAAGTWTHAAVAVQEVVSGASESGTDTMGVSDSGTGATAGSGSDSRTIAETGAAATSGSGTNTTALVDSGAGAWVDAGADALILVDSGAAATSGTGTNTTALADSGTALLVGGSTDTLTVADSGAAALVDAGANTLIVADSGAAALAGSGADAVTFTESGLEGLSDAGTATQAIADSGDAALAAAGAETQTVTSSGLESQVGTGLDLLPVIEIGLGAITGAGTDTVTVSDSGQAAGEDQVDAGTNTQGIVDSGEGSTPDQVDFGVGSHGVQDSGVGSLVGTGLEFVGIDSQGDAVLAAVGTDTITIIEPGAPPPVFPKRAAPAPLHIGDRATGQRTTTRGQPITVKTRGQRHSVRVVLGRRRLFGAGTTAVALVGSGVAALVGEGVDTLGVVESEAWADAGVATVSVVDSGVGAVSEVWLDAGTDTLGVVGSSAAALIGAGVDTHSVAESGAAGLAGAGTNAIGVADSGTGVEDGDSITVDTSAGLAVTFQGVTRSLPQEQLDAIPQDDLAWLRGVIGFAPWPSGAAVDVKLVSGEPVFAGRRTSDPVTSGFHDTPSMHQAGSAWTQKIPAGPALSASFDGSNVAQGLEAQALDYWRYCIHKHGGIQGSIREWSIPVYFADENTPTQSLITVQYQSAAKKRFNGMPVPAGARPDPAGDGHYCVVMLRSDNGAGHGEEYDGYDLVMTAGDFNDRNCFCGIDSVRRGFILGSGGIHASVGPRANSTSLLAGLIWPHELAMGRIEHRLAFSAPKQRAFYYSQGDTQPVVKSSANASTTTPFFPAGDDTRPGGAGPGVYSVTNDPEGLAGGQVVQLDPSLDVAALAVAFGWAPYEETVARCFQEYGGVMVDGGGYNEENIGLYGVNHRYAYSPNPFDLVDPALNGDYFPPMGWADDVRNSFRLIDMGTQRARAYGNPYSYPTDGSNATLYAPI